MSITFEADESAEAPQKRSAAREAFGDTTGFIAYSEDNLQFEADEPPPPEPVGVGELIATSIQNYGHDALDVFESGFQGVTQIPRMLADNNTQMRIKQGRTELAEQSQETSDTLREVSDGAEGVLTDLAPARKLGPGATPSQRFWAEDVAGGLGNAVAFAGEAAVSWPLALASMFGMGVEAQSKDAAKHGAGQDTQDAAGISGGSIEVMSEGIGTKLILDSLKATDLKGKAAAIVVGGTVGGFQEVAAGLMNDIEAKYNLKYDPGRDIWVGRVHEGKVGFTVASLLSALGAVAGKRKGGSSTEAGDTTGPEAHGDGGLAGDFIPSEGDIHTALEHMSRAGELFENDLPQIGGPGGLTFESDLQGVAGDTGVLTGSNTLTAPITPPDILNPATPQIAPNIPHISAISPTILLGADNAIPPQPAPDYLLMEAEIAHEQRQRELVDIEEQTVTANDILPGLTEQQTLMYNKISDKLAVGEEVSEQSMDTLQRYEDMIQASPETAGLRRAATDAENTQLAGDVVEGKSLSVLRQVSSGTVASTLPRERVDKIVKAYESLYPGSPKHMMYSTLEELPDDIDTAGLLKANGFFLPAHQNASGMYVDGVTYLNTNLIQTDAQLRKVLRHENVGHYGLRGLLWKPGMDYSTSEATLSNFLLSVYGQPAWQKSIVEANEARRGPDGKGINFFKLDTPEGQARATEEFIAEQAERGGFHGRLKGIWNKLVKLVMENLRKFSLGKGAKLTRAEVDVLLRKSLKKVIERPQESNTSLNSVDTSIQAAHIIEAMAVGLKSPQSFTESQMRKYINDSGAAAHVKEVLYGVLRLPQFRKEIKIDFNSFMEVFHERSGGMQSPYFELQKAVRAAYGDGQRDVTVPTVNLNPYVLQAMYPESTQTAGGITIPATADRARILTLEQSPGIDKLVKPMMQAGMNEREVAAMSYKLDKFGSYSKYVYNTMQMVNANTHIPGVIEYWTMLEQMNTYSREWAGRADRVLKNLANMKDPADVDNLFHFMMEQTFNFKETKQWDIPIAGLDPTLVPDAETVAANIKEYKMSAEMLRHYEEIATLFQDVIKDLEILGMEELKDNYQGNPEKLDVELAALRGRIRGYLRQPYFPAMRSGKYTWKAAYKVDVLDGKGKVIHKAGSTYEFSQSDSKKFRAERITQLKKEGYQIIESLDLSDELENFANLNPDFVRFMQNHLELDKEGKEALQQLVDDMNPTRGLSKHMRRRAGVKGYSTDGPRSLANYIMTVSFALSKTKYRRGLVEAKGKIRDSRRNLYSADGEKLGPIAGSEFDIDIAKREQLSLWFEKHYRYVMDYKAESVIASSLAYFNFIWAAPKAVLVNATQPIVQTYPYLGARYGYGKTSVAMAKAQLFLDDFFYNPDKALKGGRARLGLAAAQRAGVFDETLIREISHAANGRFIVRSQSHTSLGRLGRDILWAGGVPFQLMEKYNRFITFVSAFNLEMDRLEAEGLIDENGMATILPQDEWFRFGQALQNVPDSMLKEAEWEKHPAFIAGRQAVNNTQFVFAKHNRPLFMRNPVGRFAGIFQTPYLGMLHNSTGGDKKAWKGMLLMLTALGGYESLPFAKTGMKTADVVATKAIEYSGAQGVDLPINIQKELRGFVEYATTKDAADFVATGALGPHGILNITGSLDMGDPFNVGDSMRRTTLLTSSRQDSDIIAQTLSSFVGSSMIEDMLGSLADTNTTGGGSLLQAIPGVPKHMFKYAKRLRDGGVYTKGGFPIIEFDTVGGDVNPYGAAWLTSALGFTPPELTLTYEDYKFENDSAIYWLARKEDLRSRALNAHTKEAQETVGKAIAAYNKQVPQGARGSLRLPRVAKIRNDLEKKLGRQEAGGDTRSKLNRQLK